MNIRRFYLSIILVLGVFAFANAQDVSFDIGHTSRDETDLYPTGTQVNITLNGATWIIALDPAHFSLTDAPPGVNITGVSETSTTTAILTLTNTQDYDSDSNNVTVTVGNVATGAGNLTTTNFLALTADDETATFSPSDPTTLTERNMNSGAYIHILLNNDEQFVDHSTLDSTDFTLVGFPPGVSLSHMVTTESPQTGDYNAVIEIRFSPGDFDDPISGATINIDPSVLVQSTSALATDGMGITDVDESVSETSSTNLSEMTLDDGQIVLTLVNDLTTSTGTIDSIDFGSFNNFPLGTSIQNINSDGTVITIDLDYTAEDDITAPITTASIVINSSILTWNKPNNLSADVSDIGFTDESVAASGFSNMEEFLLDDGQFILTLTNDEVLDQALNPTDFVLNNFPATTTIESAVRNSATQMTINLDYTHVSDFDTDISNASIDVKPDILTFNKDDNLTSQDFTVGRSLESVAETASSNLNEQNLDDGSITLTLTNDVTSSTGTIDSIDFGSFNNFPLGTSIENINSDGTVITILLNFTGDFDNDIDNAQISVLSSILTYNTGGALTADISTITATTLTADITEDNRVESQLYTTENVIEVVLNGTGFENPVPNRTIPNDQFTLTDAPPGVSITHIETTGTTTADVTLTATQDFDVDSLLAYITINDDQVTSNIGDLTTDKIEFLCLIETASLSSNPAQLDEVNMDGTSYIDINLTDETFVNHTLLTVADFDLIGFPAGVSLDSMKRGGAPITGTDRAVMYINYTPGDFDVDYTNAHVAIDPTKLVQSTDTLKTGPITIQHKNESAALSSSPAQLDERNMDGTSYIDINLTDETFDNYTLLTVSDFDLIGFPPGVSLTSLKTDVDPMTGIDRAVIYINYTPGDFDADYTNAHVAIDPTKLVQSSDTLKTGIFTITAKDETVSISKSNFLDERNLNKGTFELTLSEDQTNTSVLDSSHFRFDNFPPGTTIESITIDPGRTKIGFSLDYDYSYDFDDPYTATVAVRPSILTWNLTDSIPSPDITILDYDENITASTSADEALDEYNLHGRKLTVTVVDDWIVDTANFDKDDLILTTSVSNLEIDSVHVIIEEIFDVYLKQPAYEDFDATGSLYLSVKPNVLNYEDNLSTDPVESITFVDENPSSFIYPDQPLDEYTLDARSITVQLTEDWLSDTSTFSEADLTLAATPGPLPTGLSIDSLTIIDTTKFIMHLNFAYNDFDLDHEIELSIPETELYHTTGSPLVSNDTTLIAKVEVPRAALTESAALIEYEMHGKTIDVQLTEDWIKEGETLTVSDVALKDSSVGLEIHDITTYADSSKFTITLKDDYHDFDTDSLMYIVINKEKLLQSETVDLASDSVTLTAVVEHPKSTITPKDDLHEYGIDNKVITLVMEDDWIIDTNSFVKSFVELVDAPAGIFINDIQILDTNTITIALSDTIVDFDGDSLLRISIDQTKLVQSISESGDLLSDSIPVIHYGEIPVALMTPSSWLREFFLDTMSMDIKFEEEVFKKYITIYSTDFAIENGPPGLSIEGLTNLADSSVTLQLAFNGIDFDDSLTNVMIAIKNEILVQQETDFLRTAPFTIKANIEPVISDVNIPNDTAMIDDVVMATIDLTEYTVDSLYALVPGATIGGYPVDSMKWVDHDQYNAWFTITEGGNDYLAADPVPVSGLRLDDDSIKGITYSGNINQDADLLDANRPVVDRLTIIGQEDKQIGDDVILLVSAFEDGLVPEDSTEINNVLMSEPNMVFEEIGGGTYTLIYTIEAGDQNVSSGGLQTKVFLSDYAGNINLSDPGIVGNSLSVDANVPIITSITNTTPSDTVIIGGEVTLYILADESGYLLADDSEVNGVKGDEGLIFQQVSGAQYEVKYMVEENDPVVAAGNLKAKIILQDGAGNRSLTDSIIDGNDVTVLTKRPTAFLTGNDEICINDTATLYITLSGTPPWTVRYHDANNTYFIRGIDSANYILELDPQTSKNYTIDSVWDGTGNYNLGVGNSLVVVNPLPIVSISDELDDVYSIDEDAVDLEGSPIGGAFYGPGVVTQTSKFKPDVAGLTEGIDPHKIRYEYIDDKGCFNADTHEIQVVEDSVQFFWLDSPDGVITTACYLDKSFRLKAINTAGTEGTFSIESSTTTPPSGFMVKSGVDTVTFNPSLFDWSGGDRVEEFIIQYAYLDNDGVALSRDITLRIHYFEPVEILSDLDGSEYCSNVSVEPITGNKKTGEFKGPGVIDLVDYDGEFYPSDADTGINWIYYIFTSEYECEQRDSAMVIVHEAPDPEFEYTDSCILSEGGLISFMNTTDTLGLNGTLEWEWVYGDIASGEDNRDVFSTMDNGSHFYPGAGRRTVALTATVQETGCTSFESVTKDLGNTPKVTIDWNTECFTGNPITFTGTSLTEDGDRTFRWKVTDLAGTVIKIAEGNDLITLDYPFLTRDIYSVEFTAITENNCFASIADTIYLRQYIRNITDKAPYSENFDGSATGWFSFGQETSPQNSWTLNTVNASDFPYDLPAGSTKAWYTDLVRKDTFEQSFVSSPCFDFSNMRRPMISFDRKISSDRDRDGAVLQYTIDDGKNWNNIGAVNDGSIEWYNTFRIQNGPGGQGEGWTGGFIFDPSEKWKQSRHDLDILIGKPRVQFRIAYGSAGASVVENEGFAFDNIWIGERSRIVLIEHFTNSADAFSNDANKEVNDLVKHNPLDIIDIQYHAELGEDDVDKMNKDNPAPASARSLFYATQEVPYALIDGGLLKDMAYDFDLQSVPFDTLDLFTRALVDPSFEILLDVKDETNALDITIDLKALESLPEAEYIVYTVIIERLINDESYRGVRPTDTEFENVVRAMAPNAAGTSLLRSWSPGDKEKISLKWNISDKILNEELLSIVVFVQGAENHQVYQTASNDPELVGDPVIISVRDYMKSNELSLLVYPNPARNEAFLVFDEALTEKMEIQLYSHTGSLVRNALIPAGTETYRMDVSGIEQGVYFIRAIQRDRIIGAKRLMIIN
ncbi:T9SS type A sorting domain-containing protein [Bacteroidota bacterium]